MHNMPFTVTHPGKWHVPINFTATWYIDRVQWRKIHPKVYMTENEILRAIGMSEACHLQDAVARHFD